MKNVFLYNTALGSITIADNGDAITDVHFGDASALMDATMQETSIIKEAFRQIQEYLDKKRTSFNLKLAPKGTPFQQKVWAALQKIPYGETRSYKQVAESIGNPKGCRAVGMANHNNPIGIIIPCHRVIGSNGKMIGYAGGMETKGYLLNLEQENKKAAIQ